MPDLIIKENELKQFYNIVDELPTKYGIQIIGFIQGVNKLRAQEDAKVTEARLERAAAEQRERPLRLKQDYGIPQDSSRRSNDPVAKSLFTSEEKKALADLKKITDGATPETVQRYLNHIGLGTTPQGKGCFPCDEANRFDGPKKSADSIVGAKGFAQVVPGQ